jgi:hypothetical protein
LKLSSDQRNVKAIKLRHPSAGTAITKVRIRDACGGDRRRRLALIADESVKDGGNGGAPTRVRSRRLSAASPGYRLVLRARRRVRDIEVDVHADYDARGMFGVDESIRWLGRRPLHRRIELRAADVSASSSTPTAQPAADDFRRPSVTRELHISAPAR